MKVGDVVVYEKGSSRTRMTVSHLHEDDREDGAANWIECQWFDGERFLTARFSPGELTADDQATIDALVEAR